MTVNRYTVSCDLDTNGHMSADEARAIVLDLAAEMFPMGHTVREVKVRWMMQTGEAVDEPTLEVVWLGDDETRVSRFAGAVKDLTFQEAVMLQVEKGVNMFFV